MIVLTLCEDIFWRYSHKNCRWSSFL